ncbi:MAG: DUF5925 domain-containing protein, partial [Acidimicrobiales bacterium]
MEPDPALPFVLHLESRDDPGDVLDASALGPFVAGRHLFAKTAQLNRARRCQPRRTLRRPPRPGGR